MKNPSVWLVVGGLMLAAIGLPLAWWLVSPLFINVAVSEALPTLASVATLKPSATLSPSPTPTSRTTTATNEPTAVMTPSPIPPTSTPTVTPTATPTSEPTPQILGQGVFYHIAHEGEGQVTIYQLADGTRFLRLENFSVLNGPDLHVYLAPAERIRNTFGVDLEGAVDLGKLKGNLGDQNYDLPLDLDITRFKSAVIWCQPFRVPFIAAPLSAP